MEVVVDAYTEEECAMSWYCYRLLATDQGRTRLRHRTRS
ncbi:calcium-binding protein [Caballeronia terrestris]